MELVIRNALVAQVDTPWKAAYPNVPLVHDNAPFDWNDLPPEFVRYEVSIEDGSQIGMAVNPKTRKAGFVRITTYARAGTGTTKSIQMREWFTPQLEYQVLLPAGARIVLEAADPGGNHEVKGWYCTRTKFAWRAEPT